MRMGRVNVYLPDKLAEQAREAGLNVSALTQEAVRSALAAARMNDWLDSLDTMGSSGVSHEVALAAVNAAKDEFENGE